MHPFSLGLLAAQRHADLLAEAQHHRLVRSIADPKWSAGDIPPPQIRGPAGFLLNALFRSVHARTFGLATEEVA